MTAKADRAKQLIEDPILKEAFTTLREVYRDQIERTPLNSKNDEALHDIRKMLHLLREVEQHLHTVIQTGQLEDFNAQEQKKHGFLQDITQWPRKA
jgi:hypothetical protein